MAIADSERILTADDVWEADDIEEKVIAVPEWNGSVRIRSLTLQQVALVVKRSTHRNQQTQQLERDDDLTALHTVIEGVIEPRFTIQDIPRLRQRSATAITKLVQAISALGQTSEAFDEAYKSVAPKSGAPVPIHAGARPRDDAGDAQATDVGQ